MTTKKRSKKQATKKYYVHWDEKGIVFESDDWNEACKFIEDKPGAMVFGRKVK